MKTTFSSSAVRGADGLKLLAEKRLKDGASFMTPLFVYLGDCAVAAAAVGLIAVVARWSAISSRWVIFNHLTTRAGSSPCVCLIRSGNGAHMHVEARPPQPLLCMHASTTNNQAWLDAQPGTRKPEDLMRGWRRDPPKGRAWVETSAFLLKSNKNLFDFSHL